MQVKRTERGWAGHFICAGDCAFRRNTLLESGNARIVVSTVGNYRPTGKVREILGEKASEIGFNRTYETMAFHAKWDGYYWDADVSREVSFNSEWEISGLSEDSDEEANQMHEAVIAELSTLLSNGDNSL